MLKPDHPSEAPDDLSPEWGEYEETWAVNVADFGDPVEASRFLLRRKRIFRAAEAAGVPKEMLAAFSPAKPGFEHRVSEALGAIARTAAMAAE